MGKWEFKKDGVFWNKTNEELHRDFSILHEHSDGKFGYDLYYRDSLEKIRCRVDGLSIEEGEYLKMINKIREDNNS